MSQLLKRTLYHSPLHAEIVIYIRNLGDNMEHIKESYFRFGQLILELATSQVVEIIDEAGTHCRISGLAGPRNLEDYKESIREQLRSRSSAEIIPLHPESAPEITIMNAGDTPPEKPARRAPAGVHDIIAL